MEGHRQVYIVLNLRSDEGQRKSIKACPSCEALFLPNKSSQKYCSRWCYHNSPETKKARAIAHLGIKNPSTTERVKHKISETVKEHWKLKPTNYGMSGKHHKSETIWKMRAKAAMRTGTSAANWKGGITPSQMIIRGSTEYRKWREAVLTRDHNKCQDCGATRNLIAHHIFSFSDFPELRFDVDNGRTLCRRCHNKHRKRGHLEIVEKLVTAR